MKLVIEADDKETIAVLAAQPLGPRFDVIVAPPGRPRTKPRALNVALEAARGELVCVFDAEDEPAPDQLRRAAAAFAADPEMDAMQGRLTIGNWRESWLSFGIMAQPPQALSPARSYVSRNERDKQQVRAGGS